MSEHKRSPEFEKHKGKIATTQRQAVIAQRAQGKAQGPPSRLQKKQSNERSPAHGYEYESQWNGCVCNQEKVSDLEDYEINGFTEVAVMMRNMP